MANVPTRCWATRYAALLAIEHENGCDVETEMWKLAHWRSPLKVLVFYDFDMQDREKARRYLIIVGRPRRWRDGDTVAWRMDRWDARTNQLVTIRPMAEFT